MPINPPQSSNQVGQYDPVSKLLVGSDGMTLKPKRVPSAFLQYCSKERPRIHAKLEMEARAAGDTVPITANKVQQAAAQLWKLLPEEVQRPYYDDYNAQMITWRAQMAQYKQLLRMVRMRAGRPAWTPHCPGSRPLPTLTRPPPRTSPHRPSSARQKWARRPRRRRHCRY